MNVLQIDSRPFHRILATGHTASFPCHLGMVDHLPAGLDALVITSDLQSREYGDEPSRAA